MTTIPHEQLLARFTGHMVSDTEANHMAEIRKAGLVLASLINDLAPQCSETRRALDAVDDAVKHANAGIARWHQTAKLARILDEANIGDALLAAEAVHREPADWREFMGQKCQTCGCLLNNAPECDSPHGCAHGQGCPPAEPLDPRQGSVQAPCDGAPEGEPCPARGDECNAWISCPRTPWMTTPEGPG